MAQRLDAAVLHRQRPVESGGLIPLCFNAVLAHRLPRVRQSASIFAALTTCAQRASSDLL